MNGPQHFAEAERSLAVAEGGDWQGDARDLAFSNTCIAAAQVHATLAQTAALLDLSAAGLHPDAFVAWAPVIQGG